jgi:hypothetical protein
MGAAKIHLSPQELELISRPDFILTKNAVLQKLKTFLEDVQGKQQLIMKQYGGHIPDEVLKVSPKISKGENYKGFPWLVLDYPRYFTSGNIFAIRTMFWWGNFFSLTLHVSGKHKKKIQDKVINAYPLLAEKEFYWGTGHDEWQHHFETGNYTPLKKSDYNFFAGTIRKKSFLKLAKKFSLDKTETMEEFLCRDYKLLVKICG